MTSSSIVIFGVLSALVLIFVCISLNASTFYNELEVSNAQSFVLKPTHILRDRNTYVSEASK